MIIVSVILMSAIDGKSTELARMHICNDGGGTQTIGNYDCRTLRGRDTETLGKNIISHQGKVANYPRQRLHVWNLVARALKAMKYE